MASYNRIIMMGNLTRDPEFRQLNSGQSVCRLGLASNRQFKNRQTGEMIQEVCFVDVDVWGPQAEGCHRYLQKGRSVLVEGRLKFDMWQDNDGQRRNKHSIVADRVTFLASTQADMVADNGQPVQPATSQPVQQATQASEQPAQKATQTPEQAVQQVKEPASQVDTQASGDTKQAASSDKAEFKGQQPFDDDLPF
jgi:single-strand DNA-binding protein